MPELNRRIVALLLTTAAFAALSTGCGASGGPTASRDGDAAIGDRGPRRTGTMDAEAPSLETNTADRENDPVP
jgi:hypothetical protein